MTDLTLYTNPMSRGRIARWMLEEIGEPYDTVLLGYGADMRRPDYLALNPMAKVPTVVHRGTVITEAAAICAYLADAFPDRGLAPEPRSAARGPYYRWLFFAAGPIEAAVTNRSFGWAADSPQTERRIGYGSIDRVLDTLEALLTGREWILDGGFSAADVYLGSAIVWGLQFGTLPERPGFRDYADRLTARPAYLRAAEIDNALVGEMQNAAEGA